MVVTAGTTNEKAVRDLLARLKIDAQVVTAPDHAASYAMVKAGKADAFATDDVLLYGLIATDARDGANYTVLPDKLSYEPYGIMFRKDDPEFAGIVQQTFTRLAESRALRWTYERWFLKRLPNGERLDIPMSNDLRVSFQLMGLDGASERRTRRGGASLSPNRHARKIRPDVFLPPRACLLPC